MSHEDTSQESAPGSTNVLDLFARPTRRSDERISEPEGREDEQESRDGAGAADQKKKQPYKATLPAKSSREIRLKICYPDPRVNKSRRAPYSHLNDIILTGHQWLSLVYTHMAIIVKGRHLDKLGDDLQDEKVRALICFQPDIHEEPEEGEPVILDIQDKTVAELEFTEAREIET